jgi:hypothetical protein
MGNDLKGGMVGRVYVPSHATQGLAKMLQAYAAKSSMDEATQRKADLSQRMGQDFSGTMADALRLQGGTPENMQGQMYPAGNNPDEDGGMGYSPAVAGDPKAAMERMAQSQHPAIQQMVQAQMLKQMTPENVVVGRSLLNKNDGKVVGVDSTWQGEQQAAREEKSAQAIAQRQQRMEELQLRLEDKRTTAQEQSALRRELAGQSNALRRDIAAQSHQAGNKPPAGYRWTPEGDLQQIPGGPADAKTQAKLEGGGTVDNVVANLRSMYDDLDTKGGIANPQKGALNNIAAGVSTSAIGQGVGKMLGTQNQSTRNTIAQQRPLLLQAIMKATGMSAKQMDSNAELKLYLSTATDPTLDVAANKRALDMIETLYGSGAGNKSITGKPASGASGGWSIQKD